jgi:hypothetical protein
MMIRLINVLYKLLNIEKDLQSSLELPQDVPICEKHKIYSLISEKPC